MKMLCFATSWVMFLTLLTEGSSQACPKNEVVKFPLYDCSWCKVPVDPCYLVWKLGCECMPGFARNEFGRCIELYLCPREPPAESTESSSTEMSSVPTEGTSSTEVSSASTEGTSITSEGERTTYPCPPNEDLTFPVNECNRCTPSSTCNLVWVRGCDCKPGYARDYSGFCIPSLLCPSQSSSTKGKSSSEDNMSSSDSSMISSESTISSTKSTMSSSEGTTSSSEGTTSSSEDTKSSSEGTTISSEGTTISSEGTTISSEGTSNGGVGSTTEICPPNEEITYPIDECNKCRPSQACSIVWVSGCDCKESYKRDDSGICIPEFLCPNQPPMISTKVSSSAGTSVTEEIRSSTEERTTSNEGSTSSSKESTSASEETTGSTEKTTNPPLETSIVTKIITKVITEKVTVLPE